MPETKIGSSDYTDMQNINQVSPDNTTFMWTVTPVTIDEASGEKEYRWHNIGWEKWLGYYRVIPQIAASVDRKAIWTVGQGFKFKGNALSRFAKSKRLGMGKESLTAIFYNLDRTGQIGGDVIAEKVLDTSGRLINLKPLNPGTMIIITNEQGTIERYEQTTNIPGTVIRFEPDEIFHIPCNRIASEVHGMSELIPIEDTIISRGLALRVAGQSKGRPPSSLSISGSKVIIIASSLPKMLSLYSPCPSTSMFRTPGFRASEVISVFLSPLRSIVSRVIVHPPQVTPST